MSERERHPPSAEAEHRLLTLLTVANLNLTLLRRQLDRHPAGTSGEIRETLERVTRAQRAMAAALRHQPRDG